MKDRKHLFETKKNCKSKSTEQGRKPDSKQCLNYRVRARSFFMRKIKGIITWREKKIYLSYRTESLFSYTWLVTDSVFRESINISSCGQDVSFSCWPYKQLFMKWCLVWLWLKVILPSSNLPKFQGVSKQFPWNHYPGSIFKWFHWRSQLFNNPKEVCSIWKWKVKAQHQD